MHILLLTILYFLIVSFLSRFTQNWLDADIFGSSNGDMDIISSSININFVWQNIIKEEKEVKILFIQVSSPV